MSGKSANVALERVPRPVPDAFKFEQVQLFAYSVEGDTVLNDLMSFVFFLDVAFNHMLPFLTYMPESMKTVKRMVRSNGCLDLTQEFAGYLTSFYYVLLMAKDLSRCWTHFLDYVSDRIGKPADLTRIQAEHYSGLEREAVDFKRLYGNYQKHLKSK